MIFVYFIYSECLLEFGNELIGKNAVLDNEISTLEERINARNAEMEHLYNQIADLQTELTLLQKTTKNVCIWNVF